MIFRWSALVSASAPLLAACWLGTAGFGWLGSTESRAAVQEPQEQEPQEQDKIEVPATGADAISRRDFMRLKLRFSQLVLEGLTTGNLKMVEEAATEISEITKGGQWVAVDDDRYRKLTSEFETTAERLLEAAQSGNVEATALRYYQMSTSCIDCHGHIRRVGYEF